MIDMIMPPDNVLDRTLYKIQPLPLGIDCSRFYISYLTIKNLRELRLAKEH